LENALIKKITINSEICHGKPLFEISRVRLIFYDYFDKIVSLFKDYKLIEINNEEVIAHE